MRNILAILVAIVLLAACSAPKYSYHFDHYDYNSGKKQPAAESASAAVDHAKGQSPLALQQENLVASNATEPVVLAEPKMELSEETKDAFVKKYNSMSKSERKEFKQELKKELKNYIKEKKSPENKATAAQGAMDRDLKLAIIFGAVGLVLTLFGGASSAFWVLGVIAIVIGVVFLIRWLMRQ
jgi:hypothetical protein